MFSLCNPSRVNFPTPQKSLQSTWKALDGLSGIDELFLLPFLSVDSEKIVLINAIDHKLYEGLYEVPLTGSKTVYNCEDHTIGMNCKCIN